MNRDQLVGAIAATLGQYLTRFGVKLDAGSCLIAADGILSLIQSAQQPQGIPQAAQPQTSQQLIDMAGTVGQLRAELAALKSGQVAAPQTAPPTAGSGGA